MSNPEFFAPQEKHELPWREAIAPEYTDRDQSFEGLKPLNKHTNLHTQRVLTHLGLLQPEGLTQTPVSIQQLGQLTATNGWQFPAIFTQYYVRAANAHVPSEWDGVLAAGSQTQTVMKVMPKERPLGKKKKQKTDRAMVTQSQTTTTLKPVHLIMDRVILPVKRESLGLCVNRLLIPSTGPDGDYLTAVYLSAQVNPMEEHIIPTEHIMHVNTCRFLRPQDVKADLAATRETESKRQSGFMGIKMAGKDRESRESIIPACLFYGNEEGEVQGVPFAYRNVVGMVQDIKFPQSIKRLSPNAIDPVTNELREQKTVGWKSELSRLRGKIAEQPENQWRQQFQREYLQSPLHQLAYDKFIEVLVANSSMFNLESFDDPEFLEYLENPANMAQLDDTDYWSKLIGEFEDYKKRGQLNDTWETIKLDLELKFGNREVSMAFIHSLIYLLVKASNIKQSLSEDDKAVEVDKTINKLIERWNKVVGIQQ